MIPIKKEMPDSPAHPKLDYAHLLPPSWKSFISLWLNEDIPSFDYGGFVVGDKHDTAKLWLKDQGVLAGCPFVDHVFASLNCTVNWLVAEGTWTDVSASPGRVLVAIVNGPANQLLIGERVALNLLARCSGIATRARRVLNIKTHHGFKGVVAGTRKTTPGFRIVEKYGMLVGGVDQHRMDLSSMIMLKDNHIWSMGSITNAVHKAKHVGGFALKIEVECRSHAEAEEAIAAGADIVMLDNFDPSGLSVTAMSLKKKFPHVLIEGSGGITEETVAQYFSSHVDILSIGSLTQGVPHLDFSLKIEKSS